MAFSLPPDYSTNLYGRDRVEEAQVAMDKMYALINAYFVGIEDTHDFDAAAFLSTNPSRKVNDIYDLIKNTLSTSPYGDVTGYKRKYHALHTPMQVMTYDRKMNKVYGIPEDIHITKNIPCTVVDGVIKNTPKTCQWSYGAGSVEELALKEEGVGVTPELKLDITSGNGGVMGIKHYLTGDKAKKDSLPLNNILSLGGSPTLGECLNRLRPFVFTNPKGGAGNHIVMLVFVDKDYCGIKVFISRDGIRWTTVSIFPDKYNVCHMGGVEGRVVSPDAATWNRITNNLPAKPASSIASAQKVKEVIDKYIKFLPNNLFLAMSPFFMYKQLSTQIPDYDKYIEGEMCSLYSLYNKEPLMRIMDIYGTEDWQDKAIQGISAYPNKSGEIVLYYNNRSEPGIALYGGRVFQSLHTLANTNHKKEIINSPKVAKYVSAQSGDKISVNANKNMTVDVAVAVMNVTNADKHILPTGAITIALGDCAAMVEDNYSETGNTRQKYDCVSLFVSDPAGAGIGADEVDNCDVDYSQFVSRVFSRDTTSVPDPVASNGSYTDTLTGDKSPYRCIVHDESTVTVALDKSVADNSMYRHHITAIGNTLNGAQNKFFRGNPSILEDSYHK